MAINQKIHLIKKIFFYIFSKIKKIFNERILQTTADIILVTNHKNYLVIKKKFKNKKILKMDSYDFETFIELKKKKSINKNQMVFIDQMFEGPFDFLLSTYIEKPIFKHYWNAVDKLHSFLIEKIRNKKLIIAAHHRRNKFDKPTNKEFVFDKTHQLLNESKLILGHESTVLRHAVLLRKPMLFVNMHMFKLYEYRAFLLINKLAKELGSKMVYIDENLEFSKGILKKIESYKINEKKYKRFEEYYLGFPGLKSYGRWKTILKNLDNIKFS